MSRFDEARVLRDRAGRFTTRAAGAPATHLTPAPRHERVVRAGAMDDQTLVHVLSWVRSAGGTTPQGNHVAVEHDAQGWTHLEVSDPHGWLWDDDVPVQVSLDEHGTVRCVVWRQCPADEMVQATDGLPGGEYAAPVRDTGPAVVTFDAEGEVYEQVFTDARTGAVTRATRRGLALDLAGRDSGALASPYRAVERARNAPTTDGELG
ncbi:MAG: hypothetical protein Q4C85_07335 [Actinomyces sp.]|uniref:hypothetical protein n=1 Tax=Actinomyces sp. TaxID=29317 RepID=UPI0026DC7751|nr:hypothetical protein [Actinomyces sp.]MDO4243556.1 hypothetical protein [Actinomyces sp.]